MIMLLILIITAFSIMGTGVMTERGRKVLAVPLRPALEFYREARFGWELRQLEAEERDDKDRQEEFREEMAQIRTTATAREREYMLEWEKKLNGGVLPAHLQEKVVHDVQTYVAPRPISYTPYQIQVISDEPQYRPSVMVHEPTPVPEMVVVEGSVVVRHEDHPSEWIALKSSITMGEVQDAVSRAPRDEKDHEGGRRFLSYLRSLLVTGWSWKGFGGEESKLTENVYRSLTTQSAMWIDKQVVEHFKALTQQDDYEDSYSPAVQDKRPTSNEVLKYVPSVVPMEAVEAYKELFRCMYEQEAAKTLEDSNLGPETLLVELVKGVRGMVKLHRQGISMGSTHYQHDARLFDTKTAQIRKLYDVPEDLLRAFTDIVIKTIIKGEWTNRI